MVVTILFSFTQNITIDWIKSIADALRLMLVTQKQSSPLDRYLDWMMQCAQSGITAVQLREKTLKADAL